MMGFWRRDRSELELAREAFETPAGPEPSRDERVSGQLPCSTPSCARQDAVPCAYVDHRGRACHACLCPEHQEIIEGRCHCQLHAGTVRAIGDVVGEALRPDIDNSAPSLVSWVARDLHDRLRELLDVNLRPDGSEHVLVDESVSPVRGADGSRRWEQSWKIVHHTGVSLKVTVHVAESAPEEIVIRVGAQVVARAVPPWFERLRRGERISSEQAAAERTAFYEPIHRGIADAVAVERTAGVRGPY